MKKQRTKLSSKLIFLALLLTGTVFAASALDGREIAQKVRDRDTGDSTHALVQMDLVDKNGAVNSRTVEMFGIENAEGLIRSVILFHRPASVKDTRFLSVENEGRDDDKWIYLPALKRVRRIAASEGGNSFMGTDFTYDDMSTREIDEDTHTLLGEDTVLGENCYKVESVPVDASSSQYSKRVSWISKDKWIPVKVELFNKQGNLEKIMTADTIQQVQGYWTILKTTMKNVQNGHSTVLAMKKFAYNENLPDSLFTQRFLQTGRP